ncbi:protein shisa-1-like isoform X1 [Hemicordylus capensis]|uniref:protein shisa-1-like isoform X1 n=1 Tax=Hemicordylus capensis TaxID=884348 RepID=UPI00230213BB|nr:protein shisa-1-like isoform X1 [Hemicordylus capensis]
MGRALSCAALALLLAQSVGCSQVGLWRHFFGGGYCWVWARHPALIGRTFRCPRREDRREDRFCCGTCFFPSCCSSRRKRLDQPWCPRRLGNGTFSRLPFSDPGVMMAIFFSFFGLALPGGICFLCFCCKPRWGGSHSREREQVPWGEDHHGSLPCYGACSSTAPLAYSAEAPQGS